MAATQDTEFSSPKFPSRFKLPAIDDFLEFQAVEMELLLHLGNVRDAENWLLSERPNFRPPPVMPPNPNQQTRDRIEEERIEVSKENERIRKTVNFILTALYHLCRDTVHMSAYLQHSAKGVANGLGRPDLLFQYLKQYYAQSTTTDHHAFIQAQLQRLHATVSAKLQPHQVVENFDLFVSTLATYIQAGANLNPALVIPNFTLIKALEHALMQTKDSTGNCPYTTALRMVMYQDGTTYETYKTQLRRQLQHVIHIDEDTARSHQLQEQDTVNTVTPAAQATANAVTDKPKSKRFDGNCNFCGKYGHRASDCRQRKRSNGKAPTTRKFKSRTTTYSQRFDKPQRSKKPVHFKPSRDNTNDNVYASVVAKLDALRNSLTNSNEDDEYRKQSSTTDYIIDTGANRSVTNVHADITHAREIHTDVSTAAGARSSATLSGNIGSIRDALLIPSFRVKVVSILDPISRGFTILFSGDYCYAVSPTNERTNIGIRRPNGLYYALPQYFKLTSPTINHLRTYILSNFQLWHYRLGHAGWKRLSLMRRLNLVDDFDFDTRQGIKQPVCESCSIMKSVRKSPSLMPMSTHRLIPQSTFHLPTSSISDDEISRDAIAQQALQLRRIASPLLAKFVMDLKGPMHCEGTHKARYALIITDYRSRYRWIYFLPHKDDTLTQLRLFHSQLLILRLLLQLPQVSLQFKSDNGGEFVNAASMEWLYENLIQAMFTAPHTPHQNGIAERSNRTIGESARAMMHLVSLPPHLWCEAWQCAVHLANRLTSQSLDNLSTPFYEVFNKRPSFRDIHIFGCRAYAILPTALRPDEQRAIPGRFLGYSGDSSPTFLFYNPKTKRIIKTAHLIFDEDVGLPRKMPDLTPPTADQPIQAQDNPALTTADDSPAPTAESNAPATPLHSPIPQRLTPTQQRKRSQQLTQPTTRARAKTTRSGLTYTLLNEYNAINSTHFYHSAHESASILASIADDLDISEALHSTDSKEWLKAINKEIDTLYGLNTWLFLPEIPPGAKALGFRWRLKTKGDGTKKARLTIKGCHQRYGRDFLDTFSPVARLSLARTLIALAAATGAYLYNLDVTAAFCNAGLEEEIYMQIPDEVRTHLRLPSPMKFAKLNKALYGLKQASRQWFLTLTKILESIGFTATLRDSCLLFKDAPESKRQHQELQQYVMFTNKPHGTWLLVYVDDLLIMSLDLALISQLQNQLAQQFKITLNECKTFLGLQVTQDRNAGQITIDQEKYINKAIKEAEDLTDTELTIQSTPLPANYRDHRKTPPVQISTDIVKSNYRTLIGMLNYIMCATRIDIAYAVNHCSKYMQDPVPGDIANVMHIFAYLKGTAGLRIRYSRQSPLDYHGFSDSSHADDEVSHCSTHGYVTMLGNGPVNWKSARLASPSFAGTNESEFRSLHILAQEAVMMRRMLQELHFNLPGATTVYVDNTGSKSTAESNISSRKMGHLQAREYAIKEWIKEGIIQVQTVPSVNQWADLLTKRFAAPDHSRLTSNVLHRPTFRLEKRKEKPPLADADAERNTLSSRAAVKSANMAQDNCVIATATGYC